MSALLKYAELERERERANVAAQQFAADQKRTVELRDQAVSRLRAFLPNDRVWNIEPRGGVVIEDRWSWKHLGYHRGLEMIVDGLTFGYAAGNSGGHPWNRLYLRTTCRECGGPVWANITTIAEIASVYETDGTQQCPACQRKQEEREEANNAAISVKDPDGRWLTISWDGHIRSGREGEV